MAKAKVKLAKAASFSDRAGNQWKQGDIRVITDEGDIRYYQAQSEFTVTIMQAVKPKPAPAASKPEDDDPPETTYSEAELKKQSKTALVELAAEDFDLDLDGDLKKGEMIGAILEAQEAAED